MDSFKRQLGILAIGGVLVCILVWLQRFPHLDGFSAFLAVASYTFLSWTLVKITTQPKASMAVPKWIALLCGFRRAKNLELRIVLLQLTVLAATLGAFVGLLVMPDQVLRYGLTAGAMTILVLFLFAALK